MIFSHVLYRLSYLGVERANRTYCKELGAPSLDDGVSKDTVDRQYDQLTLRPQPRRPRLTVCVGVLFRLRYDSRC